MGSEESVSEGFGGAVGMSRGSSRVSVCGTVLVEEPAGVRDLRISWVPALRLDSPHLKV